MNAASDSSLGYTCTEFRLYVACQCVDDTLLFRAFWVGLIMRFLAKQERIFQGGADITLRARHKFLGGAHMRIHSEPCLCKCDCEVRFLVALNTWVWQHTCIQFIRSLTRTPFCKVNTVALFLFPTIYVCLIFSIRKLNRISARQMRVMTLKHQLWSKKAQCDLLESVQKQLYTKQIMLFSCLIIDIITKLLS